MIPVSNRKLTRRQIALVDAYVANGGNVTQAAKTAGYAEGDSGRVTAQKALKTAHVQQHLMTVVNMFSSRQVKTY